MNNKEIASQLKTLLWPNMAPTNRDIIEKAVSALNQAETIKLVFDEFMDKTEWVQNDDRFDVLLPWGKHRADILREYIERLEKGDGKLTPAQAVILTGYTGILFGKFSDFHADAEKRLGRPIWTHEFPGLREQLKEVYRDDFMALQPEGSPVDVVARAE